MTAEAHAHVRVRRAIERRALWAAEDAARELSHIPLEDALQLVHVYAEHKSPKFELAARRWLAPIPETPIPELKTVRGVPAAVFEDGLRLEISHGKVLGSQFRGFA